MHLHLSARDLGTLDQATCAPLRTPQGTIHPFEHQQYQQVSRASDNREGQRERAQADREGATGGVPRRALSRQALRFLRRSSRRPYAVRTSHSPDTALSPSATAYNPDIALPLNSLYVGV
jgi:hypothetical protein